MDAFRGHAHPILIQAFFAIQLRLHESEADDPPPIEFIMRDEQLATVGMPIPLQLGSIPLNPKHPPGWEVGVPVCGPFQAQMPKAGTYSLGIIIDGQSSWEIPFRVILVDDDE